ncbi:hypothetical protein BT96DRAFT_174173 [Gymnopus androsaceus JB14]|uniref:Uncharacterized protein n=1 Tax=Gymnopus androsaceus JB14 TaxID=1447944 RepID=A0A6A4I520_9AGAR|nr:hypothetical protein BT96DRAFT_174173 [Gymnopus androsaceus JB14]
MPRRGPPSPLRLAEGPTPPRSAPKHTMPSMPRPTFCPPMIVSRSARPKVSTLQLDAEIFGSPMSASPRSSSGWSPTVLRVRGPWDHSSSIPVPFEGEMLTPLKAAIVV